MECSVGDTCDTERSSWISGICNYTISRAIIIGAMGSMAATLAHGLVDNSVFVLDLAYIFSLLVALPSLLAPNRNDV